MALLHLNINSLFNKIAEIDEILNLKLYDIVTLNETKLDESVPQSFYKNVFYNIIRRDRGTGGGGVLVFIRKEYKILNSFNSLDFEMIHFNLLCKNGNTCNFICAYKSPSDSDLEFLDYLEQYTFGLDLDIPLIITGDLNMDLLGEKGDKLMDFMVNNQLKNYITDFIRIQKRLKNS